MFVCSAFLLTRTSVKRSTIREILVTSATIARIMSSGISLSRLSYDIKSFKLLGAKLSMRTHTLQSTSVTDSVKKMLSFSSYSFYCFEFMSCYFVLDDVASDLIQSQ